MVDASTFLLGITSSIVGRVFFTLGLGIVSYSALTAFEQTLSEHILQNYHAMDTIVIQLLNLGGVGTFINIQLSALAAKTALIAVKKIQVL